MRPAGGKGAPSPAVGICSDYSEAINEARLDVLLYERMRFGAPLHPGALFDETVGGQAAFEEEDAAQMIPRAGAATNVLPGFAARAEVT